MKASNITPNNEMNYLDIVLIGYLNPNSRKYLNNHFIREFKNAEAKNYEADEFFNGCLRTVAGFESYLQKELNEKKGELYLLLNQCETKKILQEENENQENYEKRCIQMIEYCKNELKSIDLSNFFIPLSTLTKGRYTGQMSFDEVLYIENKIIKAYQKILLDKRKVERAEFIFNIDFNQKSSEYYLQKVDELNSVYRIPHLMDRDYMKKFYGFPESNAMWQVGSRFPEWPENIAEAYELFINYYAEEMFLIIVGEFLNVFNDWNEKATKDELEKVNQFIQEANKIDLREAFSEQYLAVSDYKMYLRLANDFYKNKKNISFDKPQAKIIYAKYFLFRELLNKKTKSITNEITEKPKQKRMLFHEFFEKETNINTINSIQTEFKNLEGKKMAILIYLLQTENNLINLVPRSKTQSRKHFIQNLTESETVKESAINKVFVSGTDKLKLSFKDADYLFIKEKLSKILEN